MSDQPKQKPGPKAAPDTRRSLVPIYLSPAEKLAAEMWADRHGVSLSEMARRGLKLMEKTK